MLMKNFPTEFIRFHFISWLYKFKPCQWMAWILCFLFPLSLSDLIKFIIQELKFCSFVSFSLVLQNSRGWEKIKNIKSQPMSYISFRVLCISLTSDNPNFCCFLEWKVINCSWNYSFSFYHHSLLLNRDYSHQNWNIYWF